MRCDTFLSFRATPNVLHSFSSYGKFPDSCPSEGFIDLDLPGKPPLPAPLNPYQGIPNETMWWFEFLDGTSVEYWPTNDTQDMYFDPTFAVCHCYDCDTVSRAACKRRDRERSFV
jgi:hypothetical protein